MRYISLAMNRPRNYTKDNVISIPNSKSRKNFIQILDWEGIAEQRIESNICESLNEGVSSEKVPEWKPSNLHVSGFCWDPGWLGEEIEEEEKE